MCPSFPSPCQKTPYCNFEDKHVDFCKTEGLQLTLVCNRVATAANTALISGVASCEASVLAGSAILMAEVIFFTFAGMSAFSSMEATWG